MNFKVYDCAYKGLVLFAMCSAISIAGVNISLALTGIAIILLFYHRQISCQNLDRTIWKASLFFLATVLISAIGSDNPIAIVQRGTVYFVRMAPFFFLAWVIKEENQLNKLLLFAVASLIVADVYSIWQGLQGNLRAPAFHSHPMILAGLLVQWIPLLAIISIKGLGENGASTKVGAISAVCLSAIALLFNGTRGAWLAVFVVLICLGISLFKEYKKLVVIGALLAGLLIASAGQHEGVWQRWSTLGDSGFQSNSERLLMWESAWQMFWDHPINGVGADRYRDYYLTQYISPLAQERQMHAHNNFLQMLAEQGLIGFLGFATMFGAVLWRGWQGIQKGNRWGYILFFCTLSFLLQGLTEFNYGNAAVIRVFWFIVGLAAVGIRLDENCN